jgi:hypothetical protein
LDLRDPDVAGDRVTQVEPRGVPMMARLEVLVFVNHAT